MENANSVSTPMEKCLLTEEVDDGLIDISYKETVGCLFGCCNSPWYCLYCNQVSQFLEQPRQKHWSMIKRKSTSMYYWSWNPLQSCWKNWWTWSF